MQGLTLAAKKAIERAAADAAAMGHGYVGTEHILLGILRQPECSGARALIASGALPDNKGDCDNPVAKTAELGAKFKVNATPTLVFADGSIVPGALPAQRLEAELKTAETEAKKLAAARKS